MGGRSVCESAQGVRSLEPVSQSDGELSDDGASFSSASSSSDEDDEYMPPRGARCGALSGEHTPERPVSRVPHRASDKSQAVQLAATCTRAPVRGAPSGAEGQREATRAEAGAGTVGYAAAVARAQEQLDHFRRTSCQRLGMNNEERVAAIEAASADVLQARTERTPAESVEQTGGTAGGSSTAAAAAAVAVPLPSLSPAALPAAAATMCRLAACAPLPAAVITPPTCRSQKCRKPEASAKAKAVAAHSAAPAAHSACAAEALPAKKARGSADSPAASTMLASLPLLCVLCSTLLFFFSFLLRRHGLAHDAVLPPVAIALSLGAVARLFARSHILSHPLRFPALSHSRRSE